MSVTFVVVSVVLLCFRPIFPFSSFQPFLFIGGFDSSALCRSRRELSNEYLLAKIGVDTAENEPLEGMQRNNNIPLSAIQQSVEIATCKLRFARKFRDKKLSRGKSARRTICSLVRCFCRFEKKGEKFSLPPLEG